MKKLLLSAGALLLASAVTAFAVGLWPGLPILGGSSYCASYTLTGSQCAATASAGSTAYTGNEAVPVDSYGANQAATGQVAPTSQLVPLLALGQGAFTNLPSTSSATTYTVPCTTSTLFENATVTNPTITFCATPFQGQKFTLVWGANLTTGITTAAGSGSTCLPACGAIAVTTAGTTHQWLYNGTIWYQIQ